MINTIKNLSKGLLAAAFGLVLVIAGSAFKPAEGKHKRAALYWYRVSYDDMTNYPDGYIKSGTGVTAHAEQDAVISPCDSGDDIDCLRGFASPLTVFPNTDLTTPKIQKPNE